MWTLISSIILRGRWIFLTVIALIASVMFYFATKIEVSYELAQMLPKTDSIYVQYNSFKELFGEDGGVIVIGVENPNMFEYNNFKEWYNLGEDIRNIDGIEEVVSVARCINILKNDSAKKFEYFPIITKMPDSQQELDSIKKVILSLPFYQDFLFNKETDSYLMAITLDKHKLNDKSRIGLVNLIKERAEEYSEALSLDLKYSGLPYIRTVTSQRVESELVLFVIISIIIATILLTGFFRSFRAVLSALIVVILSVIFTLGTISLLGYKITILTGIIPSLLIVIGIENCIFLINRYHTEYRNHGNKAKALSRIIQRIGTATFITNATTAAGFATFIFTPTTILKEFGMIASINIMIEFLLSIILIPIFFSLTPSPKERHISHLNNRTMNNILRHISNIVQNHRKWVYTFTILLITAGVIGMMRMETSGKVVDDMPESDILYKDLKFFEKNYGGIMPFEISIDTRRKNGVMRIETISKIDALQDSVLKLPIFAKPLSLAELLKFARQAYYNGNPERFDIPSRTESNFIFNYLPKSGSERENNLLHAFLDTNKQITRVSFQMADIGLKEMRNTMNYVVPIVDSIFPPDKYDVVITGNSLVFTQGTAFLIKTLMISVGFAVVLISLIMALLFSSFRMIVISMIPNLIPLLLVAGMMGFSGIPIKPSTIIIFSIALGISVDNAIHFLSRFRLELKHKNWNIKEAALSALYESGFSMLYSSIILVAGFSIFILSGFGGTKALGILVSITLFFAMFSNIVLLPSLLLSLDKRITTRAFNEPIVHAFDDEDDEDEKNDNGDKKIEEIIINTNNN